VLRDKQGKIINFVCTQHDITERKKAEEALRLHSEIMMNMSEGIYLIRAKDGIIVYANPNFEKMFGYLPGELVGKHVSIVNAPSKKNPEEIAKEITEILNKNGEWQGQIHNIKKDGTPFWCYAGVSSFRHHEHGDVWVAVHLDITERKKMEEEKEKLQAQLVQSAKMAAVGTLTSGITHGFSNLLQIMVGHVAFAQRTKKREDMKHALNIILDTSDRATKIIKDLLTFSKSELSEKELYDITEAIESVLSLVEEQLKKHNIKMVRKYERTPAIKVNKTEMQQVFLAIVINARDAMLPKGGKLEICVKQVKGNIEVSFSDTGKGIEKENLSKVFEPFYTTKGALGGSAVPGIGLGLSVSYGIIQRHRGTIEVNSQVGQGTTFTVKLPVKEVGPKERGIEEQKKKEIENAQYMNILVMDDEQEICKIIINWLSTEGHRVKSVLTGREAIELVKDEYFNVAFLDIIMPGIPGNIVLEEIKKISPETKVVMITGKLMNDYLLNKLIQKGASGCIQKPFGIEEIKEVLD
jgi:PAS domain S-box-containing protein